MNIWISTFASDSPILNGISVVEAAPAGVNLRRIAIVAGVLCLLFALSNHDWMISCYEEFSETSDVMEQASAEGNPVRKAAILLLGVTGAIAVLWPGGYLLRARGVMGSLIITAAAWCVLSWFWAIEPAIAARRLLASGCVAVAALAAARWLKPRELAVVALVGSTSYLILGGLVEIGLGTWHPWRGDYRFAGTLHPNNQGMNCAVLVIAALELLRQSSRWRVALAALAIVGLGGLWLTKSRTPLAALMGAEAAFWFLASSPRTRIVSALAAVWVVCAGLLILGPTVTERVFDAVTLGRADDDQVASLTGRVPLWEELSESIWQRPLQGYGFNCFWTSNHIDEISESQSWAISVAHSTYLDLILGIGLIGTGLWVAVVIIGFCLSARRQAISPRACFGFIGVLLAFGLLHGMLESAFANPGFVPLLALSGLSMLAFVDDSAYAQAALHGGEA
ncbi:MAG: O-antigen ligase family protein [Pirellulales bacterium]|nr:O-antigen ligase family protein [Pirellulales bacterium]